MLSVFGTIYSVVGAMATILKQTSHSLNREDHQDFVICLEKVDLNP